MCEIIKNCNTCKYKELRSYHDPCARCGRNNPRWELKPGASDTSKVNARYRPNVPPIEVLPGEGTICESCEYAELDPTDQPCCECEYYEYGLKPNERLRLREGEAVAEIGVRCDELLVKIVDCDNNSRVEKIDKYQYTPIMQELFGPFNLIQDSLIGEVEKLFEKQG